MTDRLRTARRWWRAGHDPGLCVGDVGTPCAGRFEDVFPYAESERFRARAVPGAQAPQPAPTQAIACG